MTFRNYSIYIILLLALIPGAAFGASIASEENALTDIDAWIEETIGEEVSQEQDIALVTRRIASEVEVLGVQVAELDVLRQRDGWLNSLRAAWAEHTLLVQIRRITLLLNSAEKQEVIETDTMSQLDEYILFVTEEVRD
jgi:hypothetical protein